MSNYSQLFSPGKIGHLTARNRVVMAPMASNLADCTGEVNQRLLAYYSARARGGAGTVIVEAACIDTPLGRESFNQINIDHPRYISGLHRLAESIHSYNSLAFIQLFHAGRQAHRVIIEGLQQVAPSPIPCPMIKEQPRELKNYEIDRLVSRFTDGASLAWAAGFDGVELHAAHGYLINQFLSPHSNQRTDEYGGSLENRQRFLLRILKNIKKSLPDLLVSVRLNMDDFVSGGLSLEESLQVCRCLEKHGADIINASCGTYESGLTSIEPGSYAEGWRLYLADEARKVVNIPVIGGGMIASPAAAEQALNSGQADFIFLGRSLIADPRWPQHAARGETEMIRPCIRCNNCIEGNFLSFSLSCTVNPEAGRESEGGGIWPEKASGKTAWIAGAGPAGLQAACSLASMGVQVRIFDPSDTPGGLMKAASIPPFKQRIEQWRAYLVRCLDQYAVEWRLGQSFDSTLLDKEKPDLLVLAVGSRIGALCIDGIDRPNCRDALEILNDPSLVEGKRVVILGGGLTGCELADFICTRTSECSIVEKDPVLGMKMEKKNRRALMTRLQEAGVERFLNFRGREINERGLVVRSEGGSDHLIPADLVILATGFKSVAEKIYEEVKDLVPEIYIIGDASRPRGFKEAVLEGRRVADRFISNIAPN